MSDIEETAKAAGEIAKLGTKTLDISDKLDTFLSNVFGVPIENAVGLMGDKLEYMRWERGTRMIDKVNAYQKEKGLERVRPIPPKFAIPMIENASLEEDDYLQDIWCKLIANNLDSDYEFEMRYAFIEIIKNLTVLDAQVLKVTYDTVTETLFFKTNCMSVIHDDVLLSSKTESNNRKMVLFSFSKMILTNKIKCSSLNLDISIHNLLRLQCIRDSTLETSIGMARGLSEIKCSNQSYSLTPLGIVFIEACIK